VSVWCSFGAPTKTDIATADAFRRSASLIGVVIASSLRSSCRTVTPPDTRKMIGTPAVGGTLVRRIPRVRAIASQYGRSGPRVAPAFSR
jgi:hypothetical protein